MFIILLISGCSSISLKQQQQAFMAAEHTKVHLHNVPFVKQRTNHCGPATLTSVMRWAGSHVNADQLAPKLYINARKGSLQIEMLGAARREGFLAYEQKNKMAGLIQQLDSGVPVIVLLNLALKWMPSWHYAVVIGYDKTNGNIILHSGSDADKTVSLKYFEFTWKQSDYWAVSLHKPGELPKAAMENDFIYATHGLERAGKKREALKSYQIASTQWPQSFIAWMGQGNIHYKEKQYQQAIKAYSTALAVSKNNPTALHNLAWSYIKLKQFDKALTFSTQAQKQAHLQHSKEHETASQSLSIYQDTIDEIQQLQQK